jgi:serine/threonine protein kinase/alpha-tubulin suppressor-like RCC1 family protein
MIEEWDEQEVSDLEDEYTILGELGRGGSAIVFRARDRALLRDVAIKVVRPKYAASAEDSIARLAREAQTVARLQHPNIVTVHAVKRLRDGGLALVMQLVPGKTLKQAIHDDGPFEPERAEHVLRDVAEALAFAHRHGVVHRDVKPENIFLEMGTGRALLADFGIAHSTEFDSRLTMTGAAIGTPAYMAPEQIDGAAANARSDVYSLGIVAWEMLTGERPWDGEALFNVIFKQKTVDLPAIDELRPGAVPPRLQYIVERMLQKKPSARWAGAEGLLGALNHWVVPADWRQWEESHKRRRDALREAQRDAARATPRARPAVKDVADDATVRFVRPSDGVHPTPALSHSGERLSVVTAAVQAIEDADDEAPSWATVPAPSSKRWMWGVAALFAVTVGGGASLMMAKRKTGALDSAASVPALADAGAVQQLKVVEPEVAPPPTNDTTALLDSTRAASARADTVMLLRRAIDSLRADSSKRGGVQRRAVGTLGVPLPTLPASESGSTTSSTAGAKSTTAIPVGVTIRATDDVPVIAAGGRHSCSVVSVRVYCWGANDNGQLGDGDMESRDAPEPVAGEIEFSQVTTGSAHSCGVSRGGEAYCWGANASGQLGDATTTSRNSPVRVAGNGTFRVLRAGKSHTCGVSTAGEVLCWGANAEGQLGDGSATTRSSPVTLSLAAPRRFASLSAGGAHTCAIATDGVAMCWGDNKNGQLGNGTRTDSRTPVTVAGSLSYTSISAGGSHSCAVTDGGEAYCWGGNSYGQLGVGSSTDQNIPSRVETTARFASVTVGFVHSCARARNGQAWCWGRNSYGQLGDGTKLSREVPSRVMANGAVQSINATGSHTCATMSDGETSCWGFNIEGQLGDGSRDHHARPTRVTFTAR